MKSEEVHIAFACDNNYLPHAGVAVKSVIDHIDTDNQYFFHIFSTDELTPSTLAPWEALKEQYSSLPISIDLQYVSQVPYENEINFRHWGKAAVVRLMLTDLLPNINKVIYMDCDMIAMQDLSPMLNTVSKDYPIAAVIDNAAVVKPEVMKTEYAVSAFHDKEYVNSGLLILDLEYLRQDNFSEKTLRWLAENPHSLLPDQDCINIVYKNKIKQLPEVYAWYSYNELPAEPIFILHYLASSGKPWKNPFATNANIYFDHKAESPWKDLKVVTQQNPFKKMLELSDLNGFITEYRKNPEGLLYQDKHGKTIAYEIAKSGKLEFADFLITEGWYGLFNVPSTVGEIALHKSIQWDRTDMTRLLLEKGACLDVMNDYNETPRDKAILWQAQGSAAVIKNFHQDICAKDAFQDILGVLIQRAQLN